MPEFICEECAYPSRLADRCDNPGCCSNPSVSQAQKDAWRAAYEKAQAEEAERERVRQIRREANQKWAEQFHKPNGCTVIPADQKPPSGAECGNETRSALEVYEFCRDKPDRYFLYVNEQTRLATTWTGDKLGTVTFGEAYRDNFGGTRVPVRIHAISGDEYRGTYFKSSGNYARIRKAKRHA